MEQHYKFNPSDFKANGISIKDGKFFLEWLDECEADFHNRFAPLFANNLFGSFATMLLIKGCLDLSANEDCGMELMGGKVDLEKSIEMDKHSRRRTVFAIGSTLQDNFEEPIYLILDDGFSDGIILLKYTPDDDDNEGDAPEVPVQSELVQAKR